MKKSFITLKKGKVYEDIACNYLESIGYRILHRNYHCRFGEIDIIALDRDRIVFVEVKGSKHSDPVERVDYIKIKKLKYCMEIFLSKYGYKDCSFEVVAVVGDNIQHIKDLFLD